MIFEEQLSRKPNHYPWTEDFKKAMQRGHWTDEEFNFKSDIQDFKVKLNTTEQGLIVRALSAIGQIEVKVKKFWAKLGDNLPHPSLYDLGIVMSNIEVVHGDAYERLLEELGIEEIFEENLKLDIIKGRLNYLGKHVHKYHADNKKQFIYSLILFTLFVENVSLFSHFYAINWFGRFRNVIKDTNKQTEYSAREETIHAMVGIRAINQIRSEHPELFDEELKTKILYEVKQAVKYENEISRWMLGDFNEDGLNPTVLENLVMSRMNNSLVEIGYEPQFEVDKDVLKKTKWFDEQIMGNTSTDFFNSRPTEYSKNAQSFGEEDLF